MIVIEKKHQQESNWQSNKDPLDLQVPEIDEPASIDSRIEGSSVWQLADVRCSQLARKMSKACPKYCGDLSGLGKLARASVGFHEDSRDRRNRL